LTARGRLTNGGGSEDRGVARTLVLEVVAGRREHLQWASKVEHVELGVQGEEDINGFVRNGGRLVCSHLADSREEGDGKCKCGLRAWET